MKRTYLLIVSYISCLLVFLTSPCTSARNVAIINESPEMLIPENGILSVFISSLSPNASSIFNTTNNLSINSNTADGNAGSAASYPVNLDRMYNCRCRSFCRTDLQHRIMCIVSSI